MSPTILSTFFLELMNLLLSYHPMKPFLKLNFGQLPASLLCLFIEMWRKRESEVHVTVKFSVHHGFKQEHIDILYFAFYLFFSSS